MTRIREEEEEEADKAQHRAWASWLSGHYGGNGWSAPIAGHRTEEPKSR